MNGIGGVPPGYRAEHIRIPHDTDPGETLTEAVWALAERVATVALSKLSDATRGVDVTTVKAVRVDVCMCMTRDKGAPINANSDGMILATIGRARTEGDPRP